MSIAQYQPEQQTIIRAGWIARSESFKREQNPHKVGSEYSLLWDIGWTMADDCMPSVLS